MWNDSHSTFKCHSDFNRRSWRGVVYLRGKTLWHIKPASWLTYRYKAPLHCYPTSLTTGEYWHVPLPYSSTCSPLGKRRWLLSSWTRKSRLMSLADIYLSITSHYFQVYSHVYTQGGITFVTMLIKGLERLDITSHQSLPVADVYPCPWFISILLTKDSSDKRSVCI